MNEKFLIESEQMAKLIHINEITELENNFNIDVINKDDKMFYDSRDINKLITS